MLTTQQLNFKQSDAGHGVALRRCRPRASAAWGAPAAAAQGSGVSAGSSLVESTRGKDTALEAAIQGALSSCITSSSLANCGPKRVGKVRDTYDAGEHLVIVTTDRQSAFDRLLAAVPFKGRVLNETSAWWFERTQELVPNALVAVPHPNVAVMAKCSVFPVEFVVRGFLTGSTSTSIWTQYNAGKRSYCGCALAEGMRKNQRLAANLVTPTTKAEDHDEPVTPAEIVERGLMSAAHWAEARDAALALFRFGQEEALKRGLLLVDTKYEFGLDAAGRVRLIDEIHTPDSSRYWVAGTYAERHAAGAEPESIDKEFLRLWFAERCDPYGSAPLPEAPPELVAELSRRYILLHDTITGQKFRLPAAGEDQQQAMQRAVDGCLAGLRR